MTIALGQLLSTICQITAGILTRAAPPYDPIRIEERITARSVFLQCLSRWQTMDTLSLCDDGI